MSNSSRLRLVLWAAIGFILVGCSDSPTGPSNNAPDLSVLLAEISAPTISSATRAMLPTGVNEMTLPAIDPGRCLYSTATGFFVCPNVVVNGITMTRKFRLIDAAGNSQSKPDAQTSAIETINTVKGTTAPAGVASNGTITLNDSSDMTLSGIRSDKHTLNGVSKGTMAGAFESNGISIPVSDAMTQTIDNVVLPNPRAGQKWPQSGSITIDDASDLETIGSASPATMHMVMTFNGTSVVTVTFTDAFGTTTCHFDLANPGVSAGACS